MQQTLAQLFVASACSMFAKGILRIPNEKRCEAVHKFPTQVEMTHKTEITTEDFIILEVVKNEKY